MNVLAFTPTHGDALKRETVESVRSQDWGGTLHHEISRHNPHTAADRWRNVQAQFVRARDMALSGDYDALWLVEHDMDVPPDAIAKMAATDADVVYGVYLFRHRSYTISAFRYENNRNIGMSLMQYPAELERAKRAGEWEVSGVGFGCTLIRTDVLKRIPFRGGVKGNRYPDTPFSQDCVTAGIRQVARFDVPCLHWCEDTSKWLHPYVHSIGKMMQVEALQTVNINVKGQTIRLVEGENAELPVDAAHDAERAGFVRIIASAAEIKAQAQADDSADKVEKRTPAKSRTSARKRTNRAKAS